MSDVTDITDLVGRFAQAADRRDWTALRALLTDEVHVDYGEPDGAAGATVRSDDLIARWRGFLPGFSRTQHLIGTLVVEASGARATATAPVMATHVIDAPLTPDGAATWRVGGTYRWDLVDDGGGWRISGLALRSTWQERDRDLPALATERAA